MFKTLVMAAIVFVGPLALQAKDAGVDTHGSKPRSIIERLQGEDSMQVFPLGNLAGNPAFLVQNGSGCAKTILVARDGTLILLHSDPAPNREQTIHPGLVVYPRCS